MADAPLPPPPPPAGQVPPPPAPTQRPVAPRAGRGRVVLWVVLGVVVVVAGCSTVLYIGGSRIVRTARAPVDTANEFLDAVRAGGPAAGRDVCPGPVELADGIATSEGQHLSEVHVSSSGIATVSGTVTLAGGRTSPLTVELHRTDDGWCVAATRFETAPN